MSLENNFQRYYEEAGPDYAAWSPEFNMHFGYFRWGMNPFRRERMLEEMNREILKRLWLDEERARPVRILDMGCGLAATLRSFARRLPMAELEGITLVPWQLEHGRMLNERCAEGARIKLMLGDYQATELADESFDDVYAVESSCYARGADKASFLREAHRLLRTGGRMVMADGFLSGGPLRGPQKSILNKLCECWVIETLGEVEQVRPEMERLGFRDVRVEPAQLRVAASVMHVPWVTLRFLFTTVVVERRKMTRARWNNLLAPILLPFVGWPVGPMAYYIVSGTKG